MPLKTSKVAKAAVTPAATPATGKKRGKDAEVLPGPPTKVAKGDADADVSLAKGNTRVFVGNLAFTATEDELYEKFGTCGEVTFVRIGRAGEVAGSV